MSEHLEQRRRDLEHLLRERDVAAGRLATLRQELADEKALEPERLARGLASERAASTERIAEYGRRDAALAAEHDALMAQHETDEHELAQLAGYLTTIKET